MAYLCKQIALLYMLVLLSTSLARQHLSPSNRAGITYMGEKWSMHIEAASGTISLYKVFADRMNFADAEQHCQTYNNAHLASFASPEEFLFIKNLVGAEADDINEYWIGLYNKGEQTSGVTNYQMYFLDGTPFVIWPYYKFFIMGENYDNGTIYTKSDGNCENQLIHCTDFKEYSGSQKVHNEFEIQLHGIPCSARLPAHVCKLVIDGDSAVVPTPTLNTTIALMLICITTVVSLIACFVFRYRESVHAFIDRFYEPSVVCLRRKT